MNNSIMRFMSRSAVALIIATVGVGVILGSPITSASMTTSRVSVMVSTMCTLSGNVTEEHSVTVSGSTYSDNIGSTTLKTLCNDGAGYSIYAVGFTDDTYGDNTMLGVQSGTRIATGTATSGNESNWAMKLAIVPGTYAPTILNGFDSYSEIPDVLTEVVNYPAATDSGTNAEGSSVKATYASYIHGSQRNDTYVGQVAYVLVHPSSKIPDAYDLFSLTGDIGNFFEYYNKEKYKGYYKMQDMTSEICDAVPTPVAASDKHYSIQLIDARDDKVYWVTKMRDGKCWMTQNLDLDLSTETTFTYYDTDIGHMIGNAAATWKPSASTVTAVADYTNSKTAPRSYDPGDIYFYSSRSSQDDIYYTLEACLIDGHLDCEHYHVGNYYNGPAAWAENAVIYADAGTVRANSICPAGWRLPYWAMNSDYSTTSSSELNNLLYLEGAVSNNAAGTGTINYASNGFNLIRSAPLYYVRAGYVLNGSASNARVAGYMYYNYTAKDTSSADNDAKYLIFNSSTITPAMTDFSFFDDYYHGFSVRCVAR